MSWAATANPLRAAPGGWGMAIFPARGSQVEMIDLAKRTAEQHGRDPEALEITTSFPDLVGEIPTLAAAGIHRLVVPVSSATGLKAVVASPDDALTFKDTIERYADA